MVGEEHTQPPVANFQRTVMGLWAGDFREAGEHPKATANITRRVVRMFTAIERLSRDPARFFANEFF
jgi:hypothetical protein